MGQKLHSKRQRKQKALTSLKRKQIDRPQDDNAVSDALPARFDIALAVRLHVDAVCVCAATDHAALPHRKAVDSNALILRDARHQDADDSPTPSVKAPKLSKSQLRKQKKVQEEHAKREKRAQVISLVQT